MNDAPDDDRTASLMTPAKLAQLQTRPRPQATPAAWLDQLASDAGSGHVRRLLELRQQVQPLSGGGEADVASALAALASALEGVDFALLQPRGWLARATGRGKADGATFVAQAQCTESAGEDLADEVRALQKKQAAQASTLERTLLEIEVELRAIEKIMDQGARWLQDMRNQLKAREAQGGDEAVRRQIAEDSQRCELLVARLKALRALSSAAQHSHQQAQSTASRRASLVQSLQSTVAKQIKDWRTRIEPLASAARGGESPAVNLEGPMDSHRDLQLCMKQAAADCAQLQTHEKSLAENLAALGAHVQAAAN